MTVADVSCDLAGLRLRNPVLAASGCAGTGPELARFADLSAFGAMITRSVTLMPRPGSPPPRIAETPSGLLNAIGIPGPGIEDFLARELPWLVDHGVTVVVSLAADTAADFGRLAQRLRQIPQVAAVEVNLSSPVVAAGRLPFSADPSAAAAVVHAVRRNTASGIPVFAKLSGDVADIVAVGRACSNAGADVLSLINAVRGVVVDVEERRPALGSVTGGLSGPAIRPLALRAVWETHQELPHVPILASGGVMTGRDALEMILGGASAVAIGSALLNDPSAGPRVLSELVDLLAEQGVGSTGELVGVAHVARQEGP